VLEDECHVDEASDSRRSRGYWTRDFGANVQPDSHAASSSRYLTKVGTLRQDVGQSPVRRGRDESREGERTGDDGGGRGHVDVPEQGDASADASAQRRPRAAGAV